MVRLSGARAIAAAHSMQLDSAMILGGSWLGRPRPYERGNVKSRSMLLCVQAVSALAGAAVETLLESSSFAFSAPVVATCVPHEITIV